MATVRDPDKEAWTDEQKKTAGASGGATGESQKCFRHALHQFDQRLNCSRHGGLLKIPCAIKKQRGIPGTCENKVKS